MCKEQKKDLISSKFAIFIEVAGTRTNSRLLLSFYLEFYAIEPLHILEIGWIGILRVLPCNKNLFVDRHFAPLSLSLRQKSSQLKAFKMLTIQCFQLEVLLEVSQYVVSSLSISVQRLPHILRLALVAWLTTFSTDTHTPTERDSTRW